MGKITREDRIVIKALLVFIVIKFASHHFLLYIVYVCKKSFNFTYALKCYHQKCSWPHFSWPTLYILLYI